MIMKVHIDGNKLVIIREYENIHFNLTKKADNRLKNEIDPIIKHDKLLA